MDRRKVLLIVAVLVAALGTAVVFLYVRGADSRADQKFAAREVLVAKTVISSGESLATAKAAGKFETRSVTSGSLVPGFLTDLGAIPAGDVALTTIYPGEQILQSKWGAQGAQSALTIPKKDIAVSVNLDDPNRVAGFLNPGDKVVIFVTYDDKNATRTRVLLPEVTVIGVGTTTTVSTTKTDASGTQTTEQLPRTLLTLSLNQADAERVVLASRSQNPTYNLTFGLRTPDSSINKTGGTAANQLFN